MAKYATFGAQLQRDRDNDGTFTAVAQVLSLTKLEVSREVYDITDTASGGIIEYALGIIRRQEPFVMSLIYDETDEEHLAFRDDVLSADGEAGMTTATETFKLLITGGTFEIWTFEAFISSFTIRERSVSGQLIADVTFVPLANPLAEVDDGTGLVQDGLAYHWIANDWSGSGNWIDVVGGLEMVPQGNPTVSSAFNGTAHQGIDFDNVGDRFVCTTGLPTRGYAERGNAGDAWSHYFVYENDAASNSVVFDWWGASHRTLFNKNSSGIWYAHEFRAGASVLNSILPTPPNDPTVFSGRYTMDDGLTDQMTCYFNATVDGPVTLGGSFPQSDLGTQWTIGGRTDFATGDYDGRIVEILLYGRHLTDDEDLQNREFLGSKYNITVT